MPWTSSSSLFQLAGSLHLAPFRTLLFCSLLSLSVAIPRAVGPSAPKSPFSHAFSGAETSQHQRRSEGWPAGCLPMAYMTVSEVGDWLEELGINSTGFVAQEVDGKGMIELVKNKELLRDHRLGLPLGKIAKLVSAVGAAKAEAWLIAPPSVDPCSKRYLQPTIVEASVLVEKLLSIDTEEYTFEVVFNLGMVWQDDRITLVPPGTQEELENCAQLCDTNEAGTCPAEGPCILDPDAVAVYNKCCDDLWTPVSKASIKNSLSFPNSKEIEVLHQEGPSTAFRNDLYYASQRIRGVFYVPMSFSDFPRDAQDLDIHLTFLTNSSVLRVVPYDGVYSTGGEFLPVEDKRRFQSDRTYEDVSGWKVSETVKLTRKRASAEYLLWYNTDTTPKFPELGREMDRAAQMGGFKDVGAMLSSFHQDFVVITINVERRSAYFIENVVLQVVLLNAMNVMAFFLSFEQVEARLTSCATMTLALMAFQVTVGEQLPQTGYSTNAQNFLKISLVYMIMAALEALIVFYLGKHPHLIGQDHKHKDVYEIEIGLVDHLFLLCYLVSYVYIVVTFFLPNGVILLVVLSCVSIPVVVGSYLMRFRKIRARLVSERNLQDLGQVHRLRIESLAAAGGAQAGPQQVTPAVPAQSLHIDHNSMLAPRAEEPKNGEWSQLVTGK